MRYPNITLCNATLRVVTGGLLLTAAWVYFVMAPSVQSAAVLVVSLGPSTYNLWTAKHRYCPIHRKLGVIRNPTRADGGRWHDSRRDGDSD